MTLPSWSERLAEAAVSKRERTKLLVERLRTRPTNGAADQPAVAESKGSAGHSAWAFSARSCHH